MHPGRPNVNIQRVDRMFGGKGDGSRGTQEEEHMALQKQYEIIEKDEVQGPETSRSQVTISDSIQQSSTHKKRKALPKWSRQVRVIAGQDEGLANDGFSWRKYGHKEIFGAKHPRGYYRCTHRDSQGCLATKKVQRTDGDPLLLDVTYCGNHTCTQNPQPQPGQEQSSVSCMPAGTETSCVTASSLVSPATLESQVTISDPIQGTTWHKERYQEYSTMEEDLKFIKDYEVPDVSKCVAENEQVDSQQASVDSTAQTGHAGAGDWQEEIYQMVKSLKDKYFAELSELYNKISVKLQHVDSRIPRQKPSDQYEKMKCFKMMLERTLQFLQINKNNIQPALREKVPAYERQIISILYSQRRKPVQTQGQQQFQQYAGQALSSNISQQQQPSQGLPQHDSHTNQMPQASLPNMSTGSQSSSAAGIQHVPAPPATNFGVPTTQQHVANAPLAGSNLEAAQGSNLNSLQHGSMSGALQQGSIG